MKTLSSNNGMPSAHVTINRNRVKTYGEKLYMKDKTNFEIEIWNPLTNRVLVSVEIDGTPMSSTGLVLEPGQRVYLDRWIDTPKKLMFSTYEADNSAEGKAATSKNGMVKVSFYNEIAKSFNVPYVAPVPFVQPYYVPYQQPYPYYHQPYIYCSGVSSLGTLTTTGGNTFTTYNSNNATLTCSISNSDTFETGRTKEGGYSDQSFDVTDGNFSSWSTSTSEWKIMPESHKPASSMKSMCSCGTRKRSPSWKFCPSCGKTT